MKHASRVKLASFTDKLNDYSAIVCNLLLTAIVFVTVMQVFLRYFVNSPTSWSEEISLLFLIWYGLLTVAIAIRRNEHISITFFRDALPPKWGSALDYFAQICVLGFMFVLLFYSKDLLALVGVQVLPASGIPKKFLYYPAFVGGALGTFNAIVNIMLHQVRYELPDSSDITAEFTNGN